MYSKQEIEKIKIKLQDVKCPICNSQAFIVSDIPSQVISYREDENGNININLPSMSNCIRVNCANCGYIMQFKENFLLRK